MSFIWGDFGEKSLDSIMNSTARINIWDGAVRSSKTITSMVAFLLFMANAPDGAFMMVGKTERTLKRNILDPMMNMVGSVNMQISLSKGEGEIFGRKVYFAGANDSNAEGKIRGLTLAGAYGDELSLWPREFFQMLLSRLSLAGAKFFGTTNPDNRFHWLLKEYLEKPGLDLKRWHYQLCDNPNLPDDYLKAITAEYSGMWHRRFILGEWCAAEGLVFDMFDESKNVREQKAGHYARCFIACDYGIHNPCVFGLIRTDMQGCYYLEKEYYHSGRDGKQKTDGDYAADLKYFAGSQTSEIIIDPSASSLITLLRREGWRVIPAKNSVIDGIRYVSSLISGKKLFVSPSCQHTLQEFSGYVWDDLAEGDVPLKKNDHCMDMLRYGVYTDSFFGKVRESFSGKGGV